MCLEKGGEGKQNRTGAWKLSQGQPQGVVLSQELWEIIESFPRPWNKKTRAELEDGEHETCGHQSVPFISFLKHQSKYKNSMDKRYLLGARSAFHVSRGVSCGHLLVNCQIPFNLAVHWVTNPLSVKGPEVSRIYLPTRVRQHFCSLSSSHFSGLQSQFWGMKFFLDCMV